MRQHAAIIGLLVTVGGVAFATMPARLYIGDPRAWREEARSLLVFHTLAIDPTVANQFSKPGQFCVINVQNGGWYSKYGLFNGLLNMPPLLAEQVITGELPALTSKARPLVLGSYFLLVTLAIAYVLYLVAGYYVHCPILQATYVLLAFYTTYLWNYLRAGNSESTQLLGFLLFWLFFLRVIRRTECFIHRPRWDVYCAWLALGILCQTRVSYLIFLPVFGVTLCYLLWFDASGIRQSLSLVNRLILLPCGLIMLAQGAVHEIKFGSPFLSGYHQSWETTPLPTLYQLVDDFVFSAQWSVFVHFPLLLLAIPFIPRFFKTRPIEAATLFAFLLVTLILVSRLPFWRGEWAYGPRYFVFILPLLALPALYPLEWAWTRSRKAMPGMFWVSVLAVAVAMAFAQLQVHRLDFFFKYRIQPVRAAAQSSVARDYFRYTHFAKINWDHLRCRGQWHKLPYYSDLESKLSPSQLESWEKNLDHWIGQGNLWWFP
jgi:hypothetical protein